MYNIKDYGALSDGKSVNTECIQRAIDECSSNGGGRVVIPSGVFITGTIFLKSNIDLHFENGAVLKASTNLDDYNADDAYEQNFQCLDEEWNAKHLVIAVDCENVSITGEGVIDGSASAFYCEAKRVFNYIWKDGLALAADKKKLRPGQLMCFIESKHILVKDIRIQNNTCWACFFHGCEYVNVSGIKVINSSTSANTDGIDLDCCRYAAVSDCIIRTGDDAIAIRCDAERLKREASCEFITVSNCVLSSASSTFRIGVGVGKIHGVRISNITVERAGAAITFNTNFGAHGEAYIEDINFSGISANNVSFPLSVVAEKAHIKKVTIENVRMECTAASRIGACGDGVLSDVALRNVDLYVKREERMLTKEDTDERGREILKVYNADNVVLDGIRVYTEDESTWDNTLSINKCRKTEIRNCVFSSQ